MLELTLFRHAKSSWKTDANSDHERPLNKRGLRDAPLMGQQLIERDCKPDRCLVSTATRTRETVAALIDEGLIEASSVEYVDELYLASPDTILDAVQSDYLMHAEQPPAHVMVIAHNPGLEILSDTLSVYQTGAMPTAAVAHFQIDAGDFAHLHTANTTLAFYITPKQLSD